MIDASAAVSKIGEETVKVFSKSVLQSQVEVTREDILMNSAKGSALFPEAKVDVNNQQVDLRKGKFI